MLTSAVEDLGFVSFDVPGWQIVDGLGKGRFSSVYSCRRRPSIIISSNVEEKFVLKVFGGDTKHLAMAEKSILVELNDNNIANIPISLDLFSGSESFHALILTPLGVPVLPCPINNPVTPSMIVTLLQVIRSVHGLGWIHRDVKPDNIYFDSRDMSRIVLSDWSSAAKAGIECDYVGTRLFGDPPDIPDRPNKHVPTPILDLRSLARTAFCLSKQRLPLVDDHSNVGQYWGNVIRDCSLFAKAMDYAGAGNYDALEHFFRTSWM